ncbi:MAG: DUF1552 domain-containing protein, partial [Verrucomicrobiaceae bacterium]|nr:DUF1552 domain-containing protein [Verrucomicrobiaceae bacterium]
MSTFTTRKSLSRRHLLRGVGATLSLPFLDAMVPAATAALHTVQPAKRLSYIYIPMGCDQSRWAPGSKDTLDELSPILRSLASVKQHCTVISNLELEPAYPGTHATSNASFLSAARVKHTESSDYYNGTTADQIAAKSIGQTTQLPSLELAMDLMQVVGQCDNGYACVYQNNLSWSTPTTPLPAEAHPRLVFEQLFGDGGSKADRQAALQRRASLLDFVKDDMTRLAKQLGAEDRDRVHHYLDSVREVERRIQKAEASVAENELPDLGRPTGVPASYAEHARLMFDLQLLAMQGDVTRVITFQLARETSNRTYPEAGVSDPHHPLSHHGNDPEKIERLSKINAFHVSLFAEHLGKLATTKEGAGTLLDHSLLLYGSGMGNPNVHDHTNLPIIVAGGASAGVRGNRHLQNKNTVPLSNLHLTLLDKAGVKIDRFGDSSG